MIAGWNRHFEGMRMENLVLGLSRSENFGYTVNSVNTILIFLKRKRKEELLRVGVLIRIYEIFRIINCDYCTVVRESGIFISVKVHFLPFA